MNDLTETMGNVSLSYQSEELEQLLFRPQQGSGLAQTALDDIPRYLFRVVCPHSVGETNEAWVRSEAASKNEDSSMEDIFFNLDNDKRRTVARMLNQHIRWWPKDGSSDNFVSWSSSLLSSLQYIYYRHLSSKTGLSIEHIDLYVIDTTLFSTGTFIRDLDLIHTFWESDDHPPRQNLENLQYLRNETKYYFGEYLSQGPLKVEGKCEIIPAQSLFTNDRLRRLQPHFKFYNEPFRNEKPEWAKEVIRLRGAIWPTSGTPILSSVEMRDRLQAVKEIIETLSFNWRFPLAIYFAALVGSESTTKNQRTAADDAFFQYFQSDFLTYGQKLLRPSNFNVISPKTMPEMKQVKSLVREIHKYLALRQALDRINVAEASIRSLHLDNIIPENEPAIVIADSNELLARTGQSLLSRLHTLQMLCNEVELAIHPAESGLQQNVEKPLDRGAGVGVQDKDSEPSPAQSVPQQHIKYFLDSHAALKAQDRYGKKLHSMPMSPTPNVNTHEVIRAGKPENMHLLSRPTPLRHSSQLQCNNEQHYFDGIRETCFSSIPALSTLDRLKLGMESIVRAPIDWWPLRQPDIPCPVGHVTVKWMCGLKEVYLHLSLDEAEIYRQSCHTIPRISRGHSDLSLPRHQQDLQSSKAGKVANIDLPIDPGHRRPNSSSSQGNTGEQLVNTLIQDDTLQEKGHTSKEIYWCVDRPWTELHETLLSVLQNSQDIRDDADFYMKLKYEYVKIRGQFRHHFLSWKTCISIEFIKFHRMSNNHNQVLPGPSEVPSRKAEYDFKMPEPADVHIKIASGHIAAGMRNPKFSEGVLEILHLIPQKIVPPLLPTAVGTEGWGLHAVQGWSFLKIVSWFLVTQLVGFVFVLLWLTFVNKTDLQNAFVPLVFFTTSVMVGVGICQSFTPA